MTNNDEAERDIRNGWAFALEAAKGYHSREDRLSAFAFVLLGYFHRYLDPLDGLALHSLARGDQDDQ